MVLKKKTAEKIMLHSGSFRLIMDLTWGLNGYLQSESHLETSIAVLPSIYLPCFLLVSGSMSGILLIETADETASPLLDNWLVSRKDSPESSSSSFTL